MSLRAMSAMITNHLPNSNKYGEGSKSLLKELILIVKDCQTRYGGKTELATEDDQKIVKLCSAWEYGLSHGLKSFTSSIFKNVTELVSGGVVEQTTTFWEFAYNNLSQQERERFSTLRHVWTDSGKVRALIRALLNERSFERYILIWLNDPNLSKSYEEWAFLRDSEVQNLLPSIAAGLGSILFAISVDSPDLNVSTRLKETRQEPVIAVPIPKNNIPRKTKNRQIINFDNNEPNTSLASSSSGSVPKSLSDMCLRIDQTRTTQIEPFKISTDEPMTITSLPIQPESPSPIKMFEQSTAPIQFTYQQEYNEDIETPHSDSGMVDDNFKTPDLSTSTSTSTSNVPSKQTSLTSSLSSIKSIEDVAIIKARLRETIDRCAMLENRIAELSLENHRLKGLNNSSRHGFNYFSVSVPRVSLQQTRTKRYYAYEVHIIPTHGGDEWTVLRRYSDFYKLHRKLQKNVAIKTLDFPPKKSFGNMDAHFVEQRRQRLQVYLRHLLAILPDVSSCTTRSQLEQAFPFFK
ncbi:Sorting nexin-29 [Pseudolycoriella hygida]|uniref:Sorting nexin-29 n=1 Tax=Pseudolycoriella hygida TaxID=35572 RepID=A0A9Q0MUU6_9DIPT|nr:Sorting nexin-29 [Pseudolycoriella hygida]